MRGADEVFVKSPKRELAQHYESIVILDLLTQKFHYCREIENMSAMKYKINII